MRKLRFFGVFLLSFAALLVLWKATDGSRWYTAAMLTCAGLIGPLLHGWVLDIPAAGTPTWVYGNTQVQASIQFDALAVGLVPLLALLAATPGLSLPRRGILMVAGSFLCFLVDTLIVALFPLLVFYKNPFTDIIGTFLGLVAFVGAPVIIWFALTFRELKRWLPSLGLRAFQTH